MSLSFCDREDCIRTPALAKSPQPSAPRGTTVQQRNVQIFPDPAQQRRTQTYRRRPAICIRGFARVTCPKPAVPHEQKKNKDIISIESIMKKSASFISPANRQRSCSHCLSVARASRNRPHLRTIVTLTNGERLPQSAAMVDASVNTVPSASTAICHAADPDQPSPPRDSMTKYTTVCASATSLTPNNRAKKRSDRPTMFQNCNQYYQHNYCQKMGRVGTFISSPAVPIISTNSVLPFSAHRRNRNARPVIKPRYRAHADDSDGDRKVRMMRNDYHSPSARYRLDELNESLSKLGRIRVQRTHTPGRRTCARPPPDRLC